MGANKRFLARLWSDQCGISTVEYALFLAFIAAGIVMGANMLSNAVFNDMGGTTALIDSDGCSNSGGGNGTVGDGGPGQGGDNTCQEN